MFFGGQLIVFGTLQINVFFEFGQGSFRPERICEATDRAQEKGAHARRS